MSNARVKRNYAIDAIKVLAMFFVVLLHNLGQGGVLFSIQPLTKSWFAAYFVENTAIISVNLFAIVTGYLSLRHSTRLSRIVEVLIQAIFWAWMILLGLKLAGVPVDKADMIKSLTGLGQYWYVQSYFGMILIASALKGQILKLSRIQFRTLLIFLLVFTSSYAVYFQDFWNVNNGYSVVWLLIMYLLGLYFAQYEAMFKRWVRPVYLWILFFGANIVALGFEGYLVSIGHTTNKLLIYNAPTVVIETIAIFLLMLRLKIRSPKVKKVLKLASAVSFGVYLIDASAFFNTLLLFSLKWAVGYHFIITISIVLIASVLMYLVFGFMEYLRIIVFKKLHITDKLRRLDHWWAALENR